MSETKPAMAQFTYSGPITGAIILFGTKAGAGLDGKPATVPDVRDIQLFPGRSYELPPADPHVRVLVELRHLTAVPPATDAASPEGAAPAKASKGKRTQPDEGTPTDLESAPKGGQ